MDTTEFDASLAKVGADVGQSVQRIKGAYDETASYLAQKPLVPVRERGFFAPIEDGWNLLKELFAEPVPTEGMDGAATKIGESVDGISTKTGELKDTLATTFTEPIPTDGTDAAFASANDWITKTASAIGGLIRFVQRPIRRAAGFSKCATSVGGRRSRWRRHASLFRIGRWRPGSRQGHADKRQHPGLAFQWRICLARECRASLRHRLAAFAEPNAPTARIVARIQHGRPRQFPASAGAATEALCRWRCRGRGWRIACSELDHWW